jgi:Domain of unknown function (DUF4267)
LSAPEASARSGDRLPVRSLTTWIVLAPAIGLTLLGLLFILAPRLGATIFGIEAPEGPGIAYLVAIGLRDLAFGLYIAALALFSGRRAVGLVLAITVLIPAGDIALVIAHRGVSSLGHLLLHAASGLYMAGASLWILRGSGRDRDRSRKPST